MSIDQSSLFFFFFFFFFFEYIYSFLFNAVMKREFGSVNIGCLIRKAKKKWKKE